jgi:hypothetical protein
MKTTRIFNLCLSLILILSGALIPLPARAATLPANVDVNPVSAPIGVFESTDSVIINGRAVGSSGALWNGELLSAPAGASVEASLTGLGRIMLQSDTTVKISAAAFSDEPDDPRRLLIASVVSGEFSVRLQPEASACLLAGGKTFTATAGAAFSLKLNDGQPVVTSDEGAVRNLGNWGVRMPALMSGANFAGSNAHHEIINWPAITLPAELAASSVSVAKSPEAAPEHKRATLLRSLSNAAANVTTHLYASPMAGLIGTVEAAGAMKINGRLIRGKEMLWDGELIEAPPEISARVALDGIGSLTLAAASGVKLSTAIVSTDQAGAQRVLVASVSSGDCFIRLQPEVGAFVQAFGATFAAEAGAQFKLGARDGRAVVDVRSGHVAAIGRYVIELTPPALDVLATLAMVKESAPRKYRLASVSQGYQAVVPLGSARELKFRITDENGEVAAGVPVSFSLMSLDQDQRNPVISFGHHLLTTPTYQAMTKSDGTVTVPFTAGTIAGSAVIIAAAGADPQHRAAVITSANGHHGFWNARTAIPVFLTAAAIVAAGVTVAVTQEDKLPIKGTGQISIVP